MRLAYRLNLLLIAGVAAVSMGFAYYQVRTERRSLERDLQRQALNLAESPNIFISTTQIGMTLIGVLAGAFGGATIADVIDVQFELLLQRAHIAVQNVCVPRLEVGFGKLEDPKAAILFLFTVERQFAVVFFV